MHTECLSGGSNNLLTADFRRAKAGINLHLTGGQLKMFIRFSSCVNVYPQLLLPVYKVDRELYKRFNGYSFFHFSQHTINQ
jgi:hypothetical protein